MFYYQSRIHTVEEGILTCPLSPVDSNIVLFPSYKSPCNRPSHLYKTLITCLLLESNVHWVSTTFSLIKSKISSSYNQKQLSYIQINCKTRETLYPKKIIKHGLQGRVMGNYSQQVQ